MDINADEHESARSVPVMIPLGKGLWNNIRQGQGYTPAAYTMPTLGTNLALALWTDAAGEGQGATHGITQETAQQVHSAAHRELALAAGDGEALQVHSQHDHGGGNVAIALGPGDMIATAVSAGGTINIRNAGETIHLHLTQHAWSVIRHPTQANLQAARHNIDATVQVELELVTGTVWHYQRRRHPVSNNRETVPPNGGGNHNSAATRRRPRPGYNQRGESCTDIFDRRNRNLGRLSSAHAARAMGILHTRCGGGPQSLSGRSCPGSRRRNPIIVWNGRTP